MVLLRIGHFSMFCVKVIQARKMSFTILQSEKTRFQATKTGSLKSRKFAIFPKGLVHGFAVKIGHFSIFCVKVIQAIKKSFTILQNEKTPFQAIKTRSSKSGKIAIFPNGLVHGFGQKLAIFPNFFLRQYRRGNCVLRCSRTKKRLFRLSKQEVQKVEQLPFFQRGQSMVLVKSGHFSMFCVKVIQARKMCFTILQNEKRVLRL